MTLSHCLARGLESGSASSLVAAIRGARPSENGQMGIAHFSW